MAQANINLSVDNNNFSKSKTYNNIYENTQEIDNTANFNTVLSIDDGTALGTIGSIKALCLYNQGNVGIELRLQTVGYITSSNIDATASVDMDAGGSGGATARRYWTMLLPAGEFIYFPNGRIVGYGSQSSAADAASLTNAVPTAAMHLNPESASDELLDGGVNDSASTTTVTVDDGQYFKKGDFVRVGSEIMEVTSISSNNLTVIRAVSGSTIAVHADDAAISLAFFNGYNNYNKYSVAQTNKNGKFKSSNFFGYGRTSDTISDGIVPGSVAFKFYNQGYQELGLSGITPNTPTGLAASTTYQFTIAVDGGSAYDLDVTTDSSNTNFGGKNGLLNKIQDVFDQQYYTSGNLFEKRVTVGIVDGDVRFTSGSHLSTSAIALGDSSGGDTDIFGVGRIPAFANIESAVASRLPDDTIIDKVTGEEHPNKAAFMYDDGAGNLIGAGSGTIDYETGAVDFTAVPNAEFVITANYHSAHSGGVVTGNDANQLVSVAARSTNQKLNATIKVIALN